MLRYRKLYCSDILKLDPMILYLLKDNQTKNEVKQVEINYPDHILFPKAAQSAPSSSGLYFCIFIVVLCFGLVLFKHGYQLS